MGRCARLVQPRSLDAARTAGTARWLVRRLASLPDLTWYPMNASLYDVLRGRFGDGRRVEDVPPAGRRELSIVSNLDRLFNTRRGALTHLPDYGLPDISEVYRDMPGSVSQLKRAIEAAVETYEPRLRRVRVDHQSTDRFAMQLVFLLTAETLDGSRLRFKTTFSSEEEAHVTPVVTNR